VVADHALASRLQELCRDERVRALAHSLEFDDFLTRPPAGCRLADLAVAVYRLENLIDGERASLPPIELVDVDDAVRHPGFETSKRRLCRGGGAPRHEEHPCQRNLKSSGRSRWR
jgi:hypothetical protein